MAEGWDKVTLGVKKNTEETEKNTKATKKHSTAFHALGRAVVYANQGLSLLGKTIKALKIPAFIVAIGAAIQAVSALAAGAVALTGALSTMSGALVSAANAYVAFGAAFGAIKLANFKLLSEAMRGDAEAMKQLSPAARELAETLMRLEKPFKAMREAVQGAMFPGLQKGIELAAKNFDVLRRGMVGMGSTIGTLGEKAGRLLGSKGFGSLFGKVMKENQQIVGRLGASFLHLVDALFQLMVAARPLTSWLTKMALAWSRNVDASTKAGRKSGDLAKFFDHTRSAIQKTFAVLSNFGQALVNLGGLGRKTGMDLLTSMNHAAKSFLKFTESTKGRSDIKDYFEKMKKPLIVAGRLLSDLTKALLKVGATPGLTKLLNMLRKQLLPVLVQIFAGTLRHLLPNLIKIIGNLSQAFGDFIGQAGPLNTFVAALAWLSGVVKTLANSNPAMKALLVTVASLATVLSAIGLASGWSRLFGMKAGIEAVKGAFLGLKAAAVAFMNTEAGIRLWMYTTMALEKVTAVFAAVKAAVLGLSFTVRGAMLATGIGALIVVAGLIIMNWDKVKAFLGDAWQWMKNAASNVAHAVGAAFKWLAGAVIWAAKHGLLGPIPLIISRWGDVKEFIGKVWKAIKAGASWLFGALKAAATKYFEIITWPYRMAWKVIKGVWGWIIGAVRDAAGWIADRWDGIKNVLSWPFRFVKGVVEDVFDFIASKIDWLLDKLDYVVNKLKDVGGFLMPGGDTGIGSDNGLLGIGGVPGLASGGYVSGAGKVMYFANGGYVPQGTDTVPAMLSPGEVVLPTDTVAAAGGPNAFKGLVNSGAGLPTDDNPYGPTDAQVNDAKKQYGTLIQIAKQFEEQRRDMVSKLGDERDRKEHKTNKKIADSFIKTQKRIAKATEKQAKKTKADANKSAKAAAGAAESSEDSWQSLGGAINDFQVGSGKDLHKHRQDIKKTKELAAKAAAKTALAVAKTRVKEVLDLVKQAKKEEQENKQRARESRRAAEKIMFDGLEQGKSFVQLARTHEKSAKDQIKASGKARIGVTRNVDGLGDNVDNGMGRIRDSTNNALDAFGVDPVSFKVAEDKGGGQKKQLGGKIVPGQGSGDKVPAMLEPGEVVWNREAVKKMGGAHKANLPNRKFRRYATGGIVEQALGPYDIPPIAYAADHAGSNSHLHLDFFTARQAQGFGHRMQGLGWGIAEYTPTHGNPYNFGPVTTHHESPGHYDGTAFDANKGVVEARSDVAQIAKMLGGGNIGAVVKKIARVVLEGPDGPLKGIGQGALDKVWNAANQYISKQAPAEGYTDVKAGGPVVAQMGKILLGNGFSRAGAAGIIGNAYRESLWDPSSVGTGGGGLFGFTTGDVSLAALQSFAKREHKPWTDVGLQMEFMLNNPNSGGLISDDYYNSLEAFLKKTNDVPAAATRFMTEWERPGVPALDERIQAAQQAFAMNSWQKGGTVQKLKQGGLVGNVMGSIGQYLGISGDGKDADKKRKNIITDVLDDVSAVGLDPKVFANIKKQKAMMSQYEDYAARAATSGTKVYGKTEAKWLELQLKKMWKVRNMLARAYKAIENKQKKLKQVFRKLNAMLHKTDKDIKRAEKAGDKGRAAREQVRYDLLHDVLMPGVTKQQGLLTKDGKKIRTSLTEIQGAHSPMQPIKRLRSPFDTRFGGTLLELQAAIHDAGGDSSASDLYQTLLSESQARYRVSQAQYGTFANLSAKGFSLGPDFGGIFHRGLDAGPVPGRRGEEKLILAQAGELVAQPDQLLPAGSGAASAPTPVVIVEDGAVNADRIRVIYREETESMVSKSRRRIQG